MTVIHTTTGLPKYWDGVHWEEEGVTNTPGVKHNLAPWMPPDEIFTVPGRSLGMITCPMHAICLVVSQGLHMRQTPSKQNPT
jgi:hypothetical protein